MDFDREIGGEVYEAEEEPEMIVEYFDSSNRDVTPLPLYIPAMDEVTTEEAEGKKRY